MTSTLTIILVITILCVALMAWLIWSSNDIEMKHAEHMDRHIREHFAPLMKQRAEGDKP